MLLMALYTVRSERLFCEQLDYNLLFRWFLDMNMDEKGFDPTVFTKNRERLLKHEVASEFFRAIVEQARAAGLMSDDHFTVDGTLIEAWASLKSFKKKDEKKGEDRRRTIRETRPWISTARSGATRRTNRRPIPTRNWRGRAKARKPSCRTRRTR